MTLLNKDEIINNSEEYKDICGIYFLMKDDEIVYVGQSQSIYSRLYSHNKDINKKFDKYYYTEVSNNELDDKESEYIFKFNPIYNKILPEHPKFKTLNQIKSFFSKEGLKKDLVDLYIKFKNIGKSKLYNFKDFDDLNTFIMWMFHNNGIHDVSEYYDWDLADYLDQEDWKAKQIQG